MTWIIKVRNEQIQEDIEWLQEIIEQDEAEEAQFWQQELVVFYRGH